MKEFWNTRYSEKEYIYGKEPNEYFKEKIDMIEAGRILLPCDGESRNGVYAATKKWEVTSLDISEKAKEKADELAKSKNVKIQYEVTSIEEFEAEDESFDCITLTFAHFPQKDRENYHRKLIKALKVGGYLILEGFHKQQLEFQKTYNSGGPQNPNMLFTVIELKKDFDNIQILESKEMETTLHEGTYHEGKAYVVRLFGKKIA